MATVVIGGLISATLLILVVLPALYVRFNRRATASVADAVVVALPAPAE